MKFSLMNRNFDEEYYNINWEILNNTNIENIDLKNKFLWINRNSLWLFLYVFFIKENKEIEIFTNNYKFCTFSYKNKEYQFIQYFDENNKLKIFKFFEDFIDLKFEIKDNEIIIKNSILDSELFKFKIIEEKKQKETDRNSFKNNVLTIVSFDNFIFESIRNFRNFFIFWEEKDKLFEVKKIKWELYEWIKIDIYSKDLMLKHIDDDLIQIKNLLKWLNFYTTFYDTI